MAHNFTDGTQFIKRYGEALVQEATELYKKNMSLREIERRLKINRQTLAKYLELIGVKTTKGNHYRKYFHNFDFFHKIDTEDKAYWLGFMYADGFIVNNEGKTGEEQFGIVLREDEVLHLEKFRQTINSNNPIHTYKRTSGFKSNYGTCRILLTSEKTALDLIEKGVLYPKN